MAKRLSYLIIFLFVMCTSPQKQITNSSAAECQHMKGALLGTRFQSYEELKKCIHINHAPSMVTVTHTTPGHAVTSVLKTGLTEKDFEKAQQGSIWEKFKTVLQSPYAIICREDLKRILLLSRRKGEIFGAGDKSFYDIAVAMTANIHKTELDSLHAKDLTEKGYINTFNHLAAQAIMTTLFSERVADYIADLHELGRMPELVSGEFSQKQIADLDNGPVDNYVDLINNKWGQELGKELKEKYEITRATKWTPTLTTKYLNDVQGYCSWALGIRFAPFVDDDEIIQKFSVKINKTMKGKLYHS